MEQPGFNHLAMAIQCILARWPKTDVDAFDSIISAIIEKENLEPLQKCQKIRAIAEMLEFDDPKDKLVLGLGLCRCRDPVLIKEIIEAFFRNGLSKDLFIGCRREIKKIVNMLASSNILILLEFFGEVGFPLDYEGCRPFRISFNNRAEMTKTHNLIMSASHAQSAKTPAAHPVCKTHFYRLRHFNPVYRFS